MNLERLTPDQNENAGHKRDCTGDKADAQSGECNDPNNNEVNRQQKHTNVFSDHGNEYWQLRRGLAISEPEFV
jgi:hypothetical protein